MSAGRLEVPGIRAGTSFWYKYNNHNCFYLLLLFFAFVSAMFYHTVPLINLLYAPSEAKISVQYLLT